MSCNREGDHPYFIFFGCCLPVTSSKSFSILILLAWMATTFSQSCFTKKLNGMNSCAGLGSWIEGAFVWLEIEEFRQNYLRLPTFFRRYFPSNEILKYSLSSFPSSTNFDVCHRAIHLTAETKGYLDNGDFLCEPVEHELDDELLKKFQIKSFLVRPITPPGDSRRAFSQKVRAIFYIIVC